MRYWLREIELIIGDRRWYKDHRSGLEITFDVSKSTNEDKKEGAVNPANIKIYNLSKDSINSIKKGQKVLLNVGYEGSRGNILSGKVESITTKKNGLALETEILVTDGGVNWRESTLNRTYQKGTKASFIMRDLANTMGYEISVIKPHKDITYQLGKSVSGKCKTNLQQLVKDTGSKMFIDNNKITIATSKQGIANGFHIHKDSGLLESPQKKETEEGEGKKKKKKISYEVKTKLNHELILNSFIKVSSSTVNGEFRIVEVKHSSDFTTTLEVVGV